MFRLPCTIAVAGFLTSLANSAGAEPVDLPDGRSLVKVDFERHVHALLDRAGCNGGKCHGDAPGRGGFSLSLMAAAADLDHQEILTSSRGRRLSFAAGDADSITASLAPLTYLFAPRGIDPASCFRQIRQIADGRSRLAAVADGKVDLAAGAAGPWSLASGGEPGRANGVRAIWFSPLLPTDSLIWRKDLDPAVKETLRQFFLTYGQGDSTHAGRQKAALAALGLGGFEPADEGHLLPIREMEATKQWLDARKTKDPARIAAAARTLASIKAERMALEARTRAPAAAQ